MQHYLVKNFISFSAWLVILLFLFPANLWADWYIVEKREDDFGNFSVQSVFISDQKIRIEQATSSFVFDVETQRMWLLFPKQMVYWEGAHDSLSDGIFDAIENQMRSMMARMPEEEQRAFEEELLIIKEGMKNAVADSALPVNTAIRETDSMRNILGYNADLFEFIIDSLVVERIWITHDVNPFAEIPLKQLHAMMRIFSKPSLLSTLRESAIWLELLQDGLVMRSEIPESPGKSRMQVEIVREVPIPASFFLPPEDYRKTGVHEIIQIMMGDENPVAAPSVPSPLKPTPPGSLIRPPGSGLGDD